MKFFFTLICLSYKSIIMRFLIGIVLMGVIFAKLDRCVKNARYTKCGTACPLTCDNIDNPPDSCDTICIPRCQCKEGFLQSSTFGCVKPKDCPKPSSHVRRICLDPPDAGFCGGNRMMWNFNQSSGTCHQFKFEGCGGNGNRYRTEEECLEKCKEDVCGENERYNECGTHCPLTCENYGQKDRGCVEVCKEGCECENGFLRQTDGRCVRLEQCENKQVLERIVVIKDDQGRQLKNMAGPYNEESFLFLVCEAGGNPAPIVTWWRNGVLIDDTFSKTSQGLSVNQMVLYLQRADFMAKFTCQASYMNLSQSINESIRVDLKMKPLYVRITTPQKPVKLGEDIMLDCETSGSRPKAKIFWWIDNELIQNQNQSIFSQSNRTEWNVTYSSILLNPGIDDNGKVVTCEAVNPELPHTDMQDKWIMNVHYNVCGENERYNECGTHCPLTCKSYDTPDRMCADFCDEGCECEKGFVRSDGGKCIRPEDCLTGQDLISKINCTDCPDPGDCEASMTRFYYDSVEKRCKEFIYGGCGGNTNNFETEEYCKITCGDKP